MCPGPSFSLHGRQGSRFSLGFSALECRRHKRCEFDPWVGKIPWRRERKLDFPGPTQEETCIPHRNSRIRPQLEKKHVGPPSALDEALAHYCVSREVPGSIFKCAGLHSRLPRGVRPRLEGRPRTPLSSRVATRVSWSPLSSCVGEGNGNPLQCSCLENPRDGGAWWAVISGVAQSRT